MKYEVQKTTHYCRCFPADKNCAKNPPKWFTNAITCGIIHVENNTLRIKTLEGDMMARMDDFIIRGVHGELYACKPSIFYETYERVD